MKVLMAIPLCININGIIFSLHGHALTFPPRIAHYGTIENFSLPAASATGGQQVLRHSWMHRTLVCSANAKNSTAGLLIVKWIQLLLVSLVAYGQSMLWVLTTTESDKP